VLQHSLKITTLSFSSPQPFTEISVLVPAFRVLLIVQTAYVFLQLVFLVAQILFFAFAMPVQLLTWQIQSWLQLKVSSM
jgi:hypothetical protein